MHRAYNSGLSDVRLYDQLTVPCVPTCCNPIADRPTYLGRSGRRGVRGSLCHDGWLLHVRTCMHAHLPPQTCRKANTHTPCTSRRFGLLIDALSNNSGGALPASEICRRCPLRLLLAHVRCCAIWPCFLFPVPGFGSPAHAHGDATDLAVPLAAVSDACGWLAMDANLLLSSASYG